MPVINFQVPVLANPANPNSLPDFALIPAISGIYIYGIKKDGVFYPFYIGETDNLKKRLNEHYTNNRTANGLRGIGNGIKELFDLQKLITNPDYFYKTTLHQYNFAILRGSSDNRSHKFPLYSLLKNDLVFWQCRSFMRYYYKEVCTIIPRDNHNQIQALAEYAFRDALYPNITPLAPRLANSKDLIRDNFYFIYSTLESLKNVRQGFEAATKWHLKNEFSLFTCGDITGGTDIYYSLEENIPQLPNNTIDLTVANGLMYTPIQSNNYIFNFL